VRTTAGRSDWGPTTELVGDIATEIARLKQSINGDIVVYASYQLVRTLMENDLVDEVRLIIFPHLVGSGGRVFTDLTSAKAMRLNEVRTVGEGLARLTYRTA
jgi:dihydrofolate reductase